MIRPGRQSNQTQLNQTQLMRSSYPDNTLHDRCVSCESFPVVSNAYWEITQDSQDSGQIETPR